VQQGRLDLDANVTSTLHSWHLPESDLTKGHPVTLRGLLSMTGGIGVPGFAGYEPGDPLPSLTQILDGVPPAHSPPVRVAYVPGRRYAYSGGGYQIVQAAIQDSTGASFAAAAETFVLKPAGMSHSAFAQPLPPDLLKTAAMGHHGDGDPLPGGSRLIPELSAGGLWSTPSDLARLLLDLAASYRGEAGHLLTSPMARTMFTRQNGGPDGLGAAIGGSGHALVLMKRGQNVGFESYLLIFTETGQGIVVMTDSDNGTTLAEALIRRSAAVYRWPALGQLAD
jgi:CubicO group peptidase (beta-lactamase class C family)